MEHGVSARLCTLYYPYALSSTIKTSELTEYKLANCTSPSWSFKFDDYQSVWDFVLDVRHVSKKKSKRTVKFAKGTVDEENVLQCSHAASGFSICRQKDGVAFPLTVYDTK